MIEQPVTVHYRFTMDEFITSQTMGRRRMKKAIMLICLIIAIIIILTIGYANIILSWNLFKSGFYNIITIFSSIAIFMSIIIFYLTLAYQKTLNNAFEQYLAKNMEVEYRFSTEGIQSVTSISHSEMLWENISEIVQVKQGFMLFTNSQIMHWIPIHGFENQGAVLAFMTMAKEKVNNFRQL